MVYLHDGGEGGYAVRNYGRVFQGYDFLFNHLASSNNILAVETLYRLGTRSAEESRIHKTGLLLGRLGRGDLSLSETVSGPQLYCAMASVVTGDGIACRNNASNHSIALGTLELSLYEQMHLFNALYLNRLSVSPARHPSLFVKRVEFSGHEVPWTDRTRDLVPFDDPAKIAPVRLALHKRLVSNPSDGLGGFDICENDGEQESNFAKSGTTDDVIRPFNSDVTDSARTCYGLWNAVLRLRLTRENLRREACAASTPGREEYGNVRFDSVPAAETVDVTLASIGECNQRFTGDRDGKSLHGYVSRELLHAYGTPCPDGFYRSFEEELVGDISEKIRYSGREKSDLPFLSRALIKLRTGIGPAAEVDEVAFEKDRSGRGIRLRGKSFRKMLKFAPYMEANSRKYRELLERLRRTVETGEAREILNRVTSLEIGNRILKRDVGRACSSLRRSIEALERTPKEAG